MKRLSMRQRLQRNKLSLFYESVRAVRTKQLATNLALTDNYLFKYIFGRSESTSYLCDFLNVIITCVDETPVKSLTLKDPALNPLFYRQKSAFLDIVAVDETNRIFNVEMQAYKEQNLPERFLDYVCGLYSRQLKAGDGYEQLRPVVGVMLLDDKVWLKVVKEFKEKNSVETYKDRYVDKVRLKSLYTDVTYSDHLTIILVRVPNPEIPTEELIDKTGNRQLAFWLKTLASPNAAYDVNLDSFEAETPGLKDMRKDMRSFLAGIGGQYVLRGRQNKATDWERAWTGGKAEGKAEGKTEGKAEGKEEGKTEGKEEEATEVLTEILEFKFNKPKTETAALLDNIPLEEIRALRRFAYVCDNYEAFIQRAEEVKHCGQSS